MQESERAPLAGEAIIDHMRMHVKRSSTNRIHNHPYAELVIVDKGDIVYTAGGRIKRVGDKSLLYNPPGAIHNPFVQYSRLYERYKIKFYPSDIIGALQTSDEILKIMSSPLIKEIGDSEHEEIYLAARRLFSGRRNGDSLPLGIEVKTAILYLITAAYFSEERMSGCERQYIDDVTEYISSHIGDKLTAEELASRHFVSKSKLNYDFKAYSNMTINEYVTLTRIERAKELLSLGRSVSSVAQECGFSSPSYFIKVFADTVGETPLKYQINTVKRDRK